MKDTLLSAASVIAVAALVVVTLFLGFQIGRIADHTLPSAEEMQEIKILLEDIKEHQEQYGY